MSQRVLQLGIASSFIVSSTEVNRPVSEHLRQGLVAVSAGGAHYSVSKKNMLNRQILGNHPPFLISKLIIYFLHLRVMCQVLCPRSEALLKYGPSRREYSRGFLFQSIEKQKLGNNQKGIIKTRQKEISHCIWSICFVGLAYQGKDIVFRFIIEYSSSLWDFGPQVIIIGLFLYEDF